MAAQANSFSKILIANRGEIACRVIHTAKAMGLKTVAVYSDVDVDAPHVKQADEAVFIGPAPAAQSYLNKDRIIQAARETGAEAIHPGYGFLSENAAFARTVADAGLAFIGPAPDATALMGDKAKAKRRMIAAGVPCVPGYEGEDQSDAAFLAAARKIGFPIMVKAAAGGGGRGMRFVEAEKDLAAALKTARSEAENAFGDGALILERAVEAPRHVEIQIVADRCGNVIHLGERDCSVQRRHQKVIEEAPSPAVTPDLRTAMGKAAIKAARDIDYVGAGTVEFLLDQSGAFYFLEMNTRLQVEHPVTEMITGLDLVALQIRVAQGAPLGLVQEDIAFNGHAVEARLYTEDVGAGFLPAAGPVDLWRPASSDGVRVDAGIATGVTVSPYYDSMLAKIIAHGKTREEARRQLVDALQRTALFGVASNKKFLIDALERPAFIAGEATTAFIVQSFAKSDLAAASLTPEIAAIAAALLYRQSQADALANARCVAPALAGWSSATPVATPYRLRNGENVLELSLTAAGQDAWRTLCGEKTIAVKILKINTPDAIISVDGEIRQVLFNRPATTPKGSRLQLCVDGCDFDLENLAAVMASTEDAAGAGAVAAPMHGLVVELFAKPGDRVTKGDRLAVLEAMKMQHELFAPINGEVAAVHTAAGSQVAANTLLLEITAGNA